MKSYTRGAHIGILFVMVFLLLVTACSDDRQADVANMPVAIHDGDECHVCGMLITNFPGPKGEAYMAGQKQVLKFCSTRDLFAHLLQPEVIPNVREIYVHDMGATDWDHPADNVLIDARKAWYVVDQPLKGAMGPTLASFKDKDAAENFAKKHNGRVLGFEEVTLEVISTLAACKVPHLARASGG